LNYDHERRIRFREQQSLWRGLGLPYQVQFIPATGRQPQRLRLYEVVAGQAQPLNVPSSAFNDDGLLPSGTELGVAGLRVLHPLNGPSKWDELIVFLGASYFRALGAEQSWGLSARGLGVDTVGGAGEEFPSYVALWIERPAANANTLTLYALLDGPRVAGAYRFIVKPGRVTTVDVQARVWLRQAVRQLGVAPLSSMFLMGENQPRSDDYRPEVHDSDGLQIQTAEGEWLWRPLLNPRNTFVTSFALRSPRGFGLLQRDRQFASYQDLEARYERRPSVWVEPLGDWGAGRVELLQFHTPDETHDNVAAYWVPAQPATPGMPLDFAWRLHWAGAQVPAGPAAWVVQTRLGHGYRKTAVLTTQMQMHIDFAGPELAALPTDADVVVVASGDANVRGLRARAQPNPALGGWRVTLDFERLATNRPLELRSFLRLGDRTLSETWSYALPAE
jgi:periplasmic glucans biosynthesis protein